MPVSRKRARCHRLPSAKFVVGSVARSRSATRDSHLVLLVPTGGQAKESIVPTMQMLLEARLKCEEMSDANNLVTYENCQKKTCAVK